jgi:hypothetical protein
MLKFLINNAQNQPKIEAPFHKKLIALAESFNFKNYIKRERLENILSGVGK